MSKLAELYYHEALDRCWMIGDILQDHLAEEPVVKKHKKIKKKVKKASRLLAEAYQLIGGHEYKKFLK